MIYYGALNSEHGAAMSSPLSRTSSPVIVGGVVYVQADGGRVHAYNANDGTYTGWLLAVLVFPEPLSAASFYVRAGNGFDYALNASTGTVI